MITVGISFWELSPEIEEENFKYLEIALIHKSSFKSGITLHSVHIGKAFSQLSNFWRCSKYSLMLCMFNSNVTYVLAHWTEDNGP